MVGVVVWFVSGWFAQRGYTIRLVFIFWVSLYIYPYIFLRWLILSITIWIEVRSE